MNFTDKEFARLERCMERRGRAAAPCDCGTHGECTCLVHEYWCVHAIDRSGVEGSRKSGNFFETIQNVGLFKSL